jgi:methyl halide transferase
MGLPAGARYNQSIGQSGAKSVMADDQREIWENRYLAGDDPWDLGCPAPPLINLLESAQAPQPGTIAVLGCGSGQDALLFAARGFGVTGFDFAPSAIARATARAAAQALPAQFLERDIFQLGTEFPQGFDYVLEHTCFCAIDPSRRSQYIQLVRQLLKPGGQLIGLFFTHSRPDGPPFGVTPTAILADFEPDFDRVMFQPAMDSIDRRQGEEHLAIWQLK